MAHLHRGAGAKRRQQFLIGAGARVETAHADGFVGRECMLARLDLLREFSGARFRHRHALVGPAFRDDARLALHFAQGLRGLRVGGGCGVYFGDVFQRAVHGALVRDFEKLLFLRLVKVALQRYLARDDVLAAFLFQRQLHARAFKRQFFHVGVHAHGHGGAGAKRRQKLVVGRGAGVAAAHVGGDVHDVAVLARVDFLRIDAFARLADGDDVG